MEANKCNLINAIHSNSERQDHVETNTGMIVSQMRLRMFASTAVNEAEMLCMNVDGQKYIEESLKHKLVDYAIGDIKDDLISIRNELVELKACAMSSRSYHEITRSNTLRDHSDNVLNSIQALIDKITL